MNYRLLEHVEESEENAITASDVMKKRGVSNLNNLLGKDNQIFFKNVTVKRVRCNEDWTKKESIFNGIF